MYKLEIHDFYNIPKKYSELLNDEILLNYPFIRQLNAYDNMKISNVNYMEKLIELNAGGVHSRINDRSIKKVNLKKLYAFNNRHITNINHMEKLIELHANGPLCRIDNKSIEKMNLYTLHTSYNRRITNINHMTNIIKLFAHGVNCGINDNAIKKLNNLKELYAINNPKITNKSYNKIKQKIEK
jgi:hypothetical protein